MLCLVTFATGCSVRRNSINIAPPKVYSDPDTRTSLAKQSERVVGAANTLSATGLNQFTMVRESGRTSVRGGVSGAAGVAAPATPAGSTGGIDLPSPAVAGPSAAKEFGLLVSESIDDLVAKEAEIENVRLLYAADTALAGRNARLYLVRFDIWLNPSRQNFWTYAYRPFDCFQPDQSGIPQCRGLRNYTEDFQVMVRFSLPRPSSGPPPVEVYAVQPTNQTITALDSMARAQSLQLAASAAWASASGQGEYETRAEEQFAEQRKFPLIQGVIDSPTEFRFMFNPRRHTVRRSAWVSWIPGVGRYSTSMFLEPGVRRVYAYLLVRDPDRLEESMDLAKSQAELVRCGDASPSETISASDVGSAGSAAFGYALSTDVFQKNQVKKSQLEEMRLPLSTDDSSESDATRLRLVARGRYYRYGNPYRNDPLFFEDPRYPPKVCPGDQEYEDSDIGARWIDVDLPIDKRNQKIALGAWNVALAGPDTGGLANLISVERPKGCSKKVDPRSILGRVFECVGSSGCSAGLAPLRYIGESDGRELFEVPPPQRPAKGAMHLKFFFESGRCRGWSNALPYAGPWERTTTATAK